MISMHSMADMIKAENSIRHGLGEGTNHSDVYEAGDVVQRGSKHAVRGLEQLRY